MAAVKKFDNKHPRTGKRIPISAAKHGIATSKTLSQGHVPANSRKIRSHAKTIQVLHVKQLPTLPLKRKLSLQSHRKPKMHAEAVKQLGQEKQKTSDARRTFKSSGQSSSNKVSKKLNMGVKKNCTKFQTSRKARSLPGNVGLSHAKKLCIKLQRQSLPGSITKKTTNVLTKGNRMSKSQQRSSQPSDSSDDDILYSLAVPWSDTNSAATAKGSCNNSGGGKKNKRLSTAVVNHGTDAVVADDTDVDSEISFRHAPKKDLNKLKRKAASEPASPKKSAAAVTSAMSPQSPVHPHNLVPSAPTSNDSKTLNFMPDLSGMPTLPGSPSATAYKVLTDNFSRVLDGNRHGHATRKSHQAAAENEEDEDVARRMSVRHSENAFKYKEIVVKKAVGYTQVSLFTQTKLKNALNPKVFQELCEVLHNATYDDSRLVMFTGSRGVFCSGIDLNFLTCGDRHVAAKAMSDGLRDFISALIAFPKPIVAAVNGLSVGLGVALLPLCDIIYASDKASFYCPYARLCQTTEGCASYTFTQVMGMAMANEMLLAGRKLTALEAYQLGLVSQVFWPTSLMQEVMPRVQNMAAQSAKALEATKLLIRSHVRTKLELTNDTECRILAERWASSECQKVIKTYIEEESDL